MAVVLLVLAVRQVLKELVPLRVSSYQEPRIGAIDWAWGRAIEHQKAVFAPSAWAGPAAFLPQPLEWVRKRSVVEARLLATLVQRTSARPADRLEKAKAK